MPYFLTVGISFILFLEKNPNTRTTMMKTSVFSLLLLCSGQCFAFSALPTAAATKLPGRQWGGKALAATNAGDTPTTLPEFENTEAYMSYLATVAALPKGFATGSASGKFVSVEAPAMGKLPIKGTIIYLTEGPSDNWAAVFTSNMVRKVIMCALLAKLC
jgi:hypothetical protein